MFLADEAGNTKFLTPSDSPLLASLHLSLFPAGNGQPTLTDVAAHARAHVGSVRLAPALKVIDDGNTLSGATVHVSGGGFAGDGDQLWVDNQINLLFPQISLDYDPVIETLTLSGVDTLANYQQVLQHVTFESTASNATNFGLNPTRTIEWQLDDGFTLNGSGFNNLSTAFTTIVDIAPNDPPFLTNLAAHVTARPLSANFPGAFFAAGPVRLSPGVLVGDVDSATLSGATVRVSGGTFAGDGDQLWVANQINFIVPTIALHYDPATETLTLSGVDTLANYQRVLQHITFETTASNATNFGLNPTRTIEWQLNDGSGFNNLSTVFTTIVDITQPPPSDFTRDGKSDIFWTTDSGPLALWRMDGFQINSADFIRAGATLFGAPPVGAPGPDWHVLDIGDVDHDLNSDIVWRTDSGALAVWQMFNNQINGFLDTLFADFLRIGSTAIGTPGPDWHALGLIDAAGDGKSDILWRTDGGALAIWQLDGNQITFADYLRIGSTAVGAPGPDWNIVGTGDFDADGKTGLLWQTDGGALATWELDGNQIRSAAYVTLGATTVGRPGADWHVADVADFNGDSKSDILWRTDGGALAIWEMDGNQIKFADFVRLGGAAVGTPGPDWHVVRAADQDGDGRADILWRTDSGALAVWKMDGSHIAAADFIKMGPTAVGAPGPDWPIYEHQWDIL